MPQPAPPGFAEAPPSSEIRPSSERYAPMPSRPLTARELIAMARSARKAAPVE